MEHYELEYKECLESDHLPRVVASITGQVQKLRKGMFNHWKETSGDFWRFPWFRNVSSSALSLDRTGIASLSSCPLATHMLSLRSMPKHSMSLSWPYWVSGIQSSSTP